MLATNSWNGQVQGLNEVNAQYQQQYGPGDYVPNVFIQYWSMRVMAYPPRSLFLFALWGGWRIWRRRLDRSRVVPVAGRVGGCTPFVINTAGLDAHRERPAAVDRPGPDEDQQRRLAGGEHGWVVTSILTFLLLYTVLAVVAWGLMVRYTRRGPEPDEPVAEPVARHAASPP